MNLYQFTLEVQDGVNGYEHKEFVLAEADAMASRFANEFARNCDVRYPSRHLFGAGGLAAVDACELCSYFASDRSGRRHTVDCPSGFGP
jgi:hypothetical protein